MQYRFAGLFHKDTTCVGYRNGLVIAIEKPEALLALQLIDLFAQGGLTDVQSVSGA
jgi:hypothetical protein